MKLYPVSILAVLIFACIIPAAAQLSSLGDNEFYISEGLLSYDQLAGISGQNTNARFITSFPSKISGAAFFTYRHYFTNRAALGLTLGMDNQTGDLSYGPEGIIGYMGNNGYGPSGFYRREVYTGAAELLVVYRHEYKFKVYGYIGAGYTSVRTTLNFFDNISAQSYFYGTPSSLFLHKNTTVDFSHFNFQVTPLAVRTSGDLGVFCELGFGYKGIACCGVSYKFNYGKHKQPKLKLVNPGEAILLPFDFPVEDYGNVHSLAKIKVRNTAYTKFARFTRNKHIEGAGFSHGVGDVVSETEKQKGNIFQVATIADPNQDDNYTITGRVYFTPDFDSFKTTVLAEKNKEFKNGQCAFLIVYRPRYNRSGSKFFKSYISINDSTTVKMVESSKYIIKVTREGTYKIGPVNSNEFVKIDVKFGKDYYIKTCMDAAHGHQRRSMPSHVFYVDNVQGDLESSVSRFEHSMELMNCVEHMQ